MTTVTDEIVNVLATIQELNINQCAATTYDMSMQECVRKEITLALARHYGVDYTVPYRPSPSAFPVKTVRRA